LDLGIHVGGTDVITASYGFSIVNDMENDWNGGYSPSGSVLLKGTNSWSQPVFKLIQGAHLRIAGSEFRIRFHGMASPRLILGFGRMEKKDRQ
jgi:hypothetical protein